MNNPLQIIETNWVDNGFQLSRLVFPAYMGKFMIWIDKHPPPKGLGRIVTWIFRVTGCYMQVKPKSYI